MWSVVVSLSRMCNEPCFASVTFRLIDYKQRSFNKQGCCLLTMLRSVIDEITRIARGKTPCFCSRRVACKIKAAPLSSFSCAHMRVTTIARFKTRDESYKIFMLRCKKYTLIEKSTWRCICCCGLKRLNCLSLMCFSHPLRPSFSPLTLTKTFLFELPNTAHC